MFDSNKWMDADTKEKAKEKALAIVAPVVPPEQGTLDNHYEGLSITDDPSVNIINVLNHNARRHTAKFQMEPERDNIVNPEQLEVTAFYYAATNRIYLYAGILQKPLYDRVSAIRSNRIHYRTRIHACI